MYMPRLTFLPKTSSVFIVCVNFVLLRFIFICRSWSQSLKTAWLNVGRRKKSSGGEVWEDYLKKERGRNKAKRRLMKIERLTDKKLIEENQEREIAEENSKREETTRTGRDANS